MVDITNKIITHRVAIAEATVHVSAQETIDAIQQKTVPKGDVFEASRVAGLFGIKRTSDMIPDCHPLPVEFAAVRFRIEGLDIFIETEVHTLYKTGVELEAMHGASVAALTVYDMLKPIDKGIEIRNIRLVKKKGGKGQYTDLPKRELKVAVIVCSDSISAGKKQDFAGKEIISHLEKWGVQTQDYSIIPDELAVIQSRVQELYNQQYDMILLTGGTGLSPRDVTPEAIRPMLDREIPGVAEAARQYGQQHMPYSMLSRSLAGLKGKTLIMALPGSTRGAAESMDALFPYILHIFRVSEGMPHGE